LGRNFQMDDKLEAEAKIEPVLALGNTKKSV
jgi:hypothetical protein